MEEEGEGEDRKDMIYSWVEMEVTGKEGVEKKERGRASGGKRDSFHSPFTPFEPFPSPLSFSFVSPVCSKGEIALPLPPHSAPPYDDSFSSPLSTFVAL